MEREENKLEMKKRNENKRGIFFYLKLYYQCRTNELILLIYEDDTSFP